MYDSWLWFVVSIGHCGTRWLAEVLDAQSGMAFYHELKHRVTGIPWHESLEYEERHGAHGERFDAYWQTFEEDRDVYDVVGDSNSWVPTNVPADPDRIIYLVRHGVSQIHSLYTQSGVWSGVPLDHFALDGYLRKYWVLAGKPGKPWPEWGRWERICLLWVSNGIMPMRFMEQGRTVDVYRFEDLTQGHALRQLGLSHDEMVRWRERDINRKVRGSRRPEDIWASWSDDQRDAFRRICGDTMQRYGYEIPG